MMENQSGIYEILNLVNGKRYIGSAVNFKKRWKKHRTELCTQAHHSRHLQSAWNKYGADSFKFRVILTCAPTKQMLMFYEQQLLDKVLPEYNIAPRADSPLGIKRAPEFCQAISRRNKGNHYAVGNKNGLGYEHTDDAKARIGAAHRGNQHAKGYRHTLEEIEKIRAASTGRKSSPETRAKIVVVRTGKKHTAASIEKMRLAKLGKKRPLAIALEVLRAN